jgi:hypothetical protein
MSAFRRTLAVGGGTVEIIIDKEELDIHFDNLWSLCQSQDREFAAGLQEATGLEFDWAATERIDVEYPEEIEVDAETVTAAAFEYITNWFDKEDED